MTDLNGEGRTVMQRHNPDQIEMEEASFVKGTVAAVIYHNETNLYTVLKVKVEETSESLKTNRFCHRLLSFDP
ncbi:hypothetical protein PO124_20765 [Bacillus licheniformis]|nr:hypothetical protein [Bacillus licheniformis]